MLQRSDATAVVCRRTARERIAARCVLAISLAACGPIVPGSDHDAGDDAGDDAGGDHGCDSAPTGPTVLYSSETLGGVLGSILAVSDCRVYWVSQEHEFHGEASSVFKDGSDLRRHMPDVRDPSAIAAIDDRVFVLVPSGIVAVPYDGAGDPTPVLTVQTAHMRTTGAMIDVLSMGRITRFDTATDTTEDYDVDPSTAAFAVFGATIYAATMQSLVAIDIETHAVSHVADLPWAARDLVVDAETAYAVIEDEILRVDLATGTSEVVVEGAWSTWHMALDDDYVYWADSGSGEPYREGGIWAWPRAGGMKILVAAEPAARSLAIDDTSIYWTSDTPGKVVRSPKP